MSMGEPLSGPNFDFRIIENFESWPSKYELQIKKWWGWKTVDYSDNIPDLKSKASKLRKGHRIVEEFD